VATVVLQATLPTGLAPYNQAFVFVLVIAVLVVRPEGFLGARLTEERA